MASQVDIYNYALGSIGQSETVASLTEKSKAQIVCTQFYELARDTVLADFPWPFATKTATLALLTNQSANYSYTYQYPVDCLRANFIVAAGMDVQPDEKLQPRWETAYGLNGQVILTNQAAAVLSYVTRVTDVGRFPILFVETLALKLGALIAMPMTNTRAIADGAAANYQGAVQGAAAQAANQSKYRHDHTSEYIIARGQ